MAIIPAPTLRQLADEDLALAIGAVLFPGFVHRLADKNGLFLKVVGPIDDRGLRDVAAKRFQIVLGLVRAWRPIAGEREDEVRPGIGSGPIRGDDGGQLVEIGPAIEYVVSPGEVEAFARRAATAVASSDRLRSAVWLLGRRDRNSADYFMIHELATHDFGGTDGVRQALSVSAKDLDRLTRSANNLAPEEGGRHAGGTRDAEWGLEVQRDFIATFLRRWIDHSVRPTRSPMTDESAAG